MNAAADSNIGDHDMVTVPTAVAMGTVFSSGPCTLQYDTWYPVVARRLAEAMRGLASMANAGIDSLAGSTTFLCATVCTCAIVLACNQRARWSSVLGQFVWPDSGVQSAPSA